MRSRTLARLAPLAGIAFVVLVVAVVALEGDEPSESAAPAEVVDHWLDRSDTSLLAVFLAIAASGFLLTFAATLRSAIRAAEPGEASSSAVAFAGATVTAAGLLFSAATSLAASDTAERGLVAATSALDALAQSAWVPITGGLAAMLIAAGIGGIRTGALPRLLGGSAIVLGLAFVTPAGLVAFLATPLWIVATSLVVFRRQSSDGVARVAAASGS